MRFRVLASALALLAAANAPALAQEKFHHYANSLAPYVVSPQETVDRMLELAEVKRGDVVYDLGSGDGRVLFTAVQHFRAKAVGVEISDSLVQNTNDKIQKLGLQNWMYVIHGDLLQVDLSPADVVVLYLMTDSNGLLRPNLEKYLHAGARVVSHEYAVPGWKPNQVDEAEPGSRHHRIYLYVMPPKKS